MAALSLSRGCLSTPSQRLALAKIFSLHRLHLFANCSSGESFLIESAPQGRVALPGCDIGRSPVPSLEDVALQSVRIG
jgi:hypothetical protein